MTLLFVLIYMVYANWFINKLNMFFILLTIFNVWIACWFFLVRFPLGISFFLLISRDSLCCFSVDKSCRTLCGSSVLHHPLEFAQIRVHWVHDSI